MNERVCILVSMGWGVRNVLMSRAMDEIAPCEIHVLSVFNEHEAYRERFKHFKSLEELEEIKLSNTARGLYLMTTNMYYKLSPSVTHQHKIKVAKRSGMVRSAAYHLAVRFGSKRTLQLAEAMFMRRLRRLPAYRQYKSYLQANKIDTVISSNPLNRNEYPVLLAAADLGLRTVAIITSWDNLTSKRPLVINFDEYLVWNQIMADEVKQYCGSHSAKIGEIGPLQFDFYFDPHWSDDRATFCRSLGFDPARKIVVHSTVTPQLLPDEPLLVERLLQALKEGRIDGSPNFLVRLHPKRTFEEFRALSEDPRWKGMHVAWNEAGAGIRKANDRWCPLDDEIRLLTNTVAHGDVNLNVFSTMLLDFAVLGKPAVLIAHSGADEPLHYETYEHLKPVLATNSHRIGRNLDQTIDYLNQYLAQPQLDAEGRQKLVELEGGRYLGQGWKRLAQAILAHVPMEHHPPQELSEQMAHAQAEQA